MEIIPPYLRIYQQILKDLENAIPFLNVPKPKAGRKPKLTDIHKAANFILSYITNTNRIHIKGNVAVAKEEILSYLGFYEDMPLSSQNWQRAFKLSSW